MVDVQSDVGGKLIEGWKLLSREIVGNDRLCLRPDIKASDDADCEGGRGPLAECPVTRALSRPPAGAVDAMENRLSAKQRRDGAADSAS